MVTSSTYVIRTLLYLSVVKIITGLTYPHLMRYSLNLLTGNASRAKLILGTQYLALPPSSQSNHSPTVSRLALLSNISQAHITPTDMPPEPFTPPTGEQLLHSPNTTSSPVIGTETVAPITGDGLASLVALANEGLVLDPEIFSESASPPSPTPPLRRKKGDTLPVEQWKYKKIRRQQPSRVFMDNLRPVYEPKYYFEDGLRRVVPYNYTYNTFCKERWRGKTLVEIFSLEFRDRPQEYYVCLIFLQIMKIS